MQYTGTVIDSQTGAPIPGATVRHSANNQVLNQEIADAQGQFTAYTYIPADTVTITSAGYKGFSWPASAYQNKFELERNFVTLPPAVVTSGGKGKFPIALALLPLLFIKGEKGKQKVSGVDANTVLLVGGGLIGLSLVSKLFNTLGIWNGPGGTAVAHEQTNPNSPWKAAFWQSAYNSGTEVTLLTADAVNTFCQQIHDAFTVFQDDFNQIMAVFSQLKTKSQVSYLADKFQQRYREDLLSFLKDGGGILPWDGLSDTHLKVLTDLVNNLPQYKPR